MPRGTCRDCLAARKKQYEAEGRLTPKSLAAKRESQRRYAARHLDRRRKAHRDYMQRVKADPEKHARFLEARRIAYRLKAERAGRSLDSIRAPKSKTASGTWRYLPSMPLVALINGILERREAVADLLCNAEGAGLEGVCADLGVSSRNYRRWRDGSQPTVQIATAELMLLNAGVEWSDCYSYDDYAHIFLDGVPIDVL